MAQDLDSLLNDLFSGGSSNSTASAVGTQQNTSPTPFASLATQVADPSVLGPQIGKDVAKATDSARGDADFASQVLARTQQRQQQNVALVTDVSAKRDAETSNILDDTQSYATTVKPLLQKSAAIADRQAEIVAMNPFKRFLTNFTGLANNENYLADQQTAIHGQIAAHTSEFQSLMGIHKNTIDALNQHEMDQQDILQAGTNSDESIFKAKGALTGALDHVVGEGLQAIKANTDLVQSNAALRQDTIGQMTMDQATKGLAMAQKNGGVARINGIDIPAAQLQERVNTWKEMNYDLSSKALALKANQLGLADEAERHALQHMAPSQIEFIMHNGGKDAQGNTFGMANLANAYEASKAVRQGMIDQENSSAGVDTYRSMLNTIGMNNSNLRQRTQDLFGVTPQAFETGNRQLATTLNGLTDGYKDAFAKGGVNGARAYVQSKLPELQQVLKQQDGMAEQFATQWAGNNPNMKIVAKGYLTGQPVNAGTTASALVEMVHAGTPPGTFMTPAAANNFTQIQQVVHDYDKQKDAQSFTGKLAAGEKAKKGVVDQDLLDKVIPLMQNTHTQSLNTKILYNTPAMAASIKNPDGTPLNASRINPQDLASASNYGDQEGLAIAAKATGVDVGTLTKIMQDKGGASGREYAAYVAKMKADKMQPKPYEDLASTTSSAQTQSMLQHLRLTPSGSMGFDPAKAMIEAWHHPEFQQQGMRLSALEGTKSAGDFMIHQVGGSNFGTSFLNYADTMQQALTANDANQSRALAVANTKMRNIDPVGTATLALHSIPGVSETDGSKLMDAVIPRANELIQSGAVPMTNTGDAIDRVIKTQKFEDPGLERIRQMAAKDWDKHRQITLKGLQGFLASAQGNMENLGVTAAKAYQNLPPVQ